LRLKTVKQFSLEHLKINILTNCLTAKNELWAIALTM